MPNAPNQIGPLVISLVLFVGLFGVIALLLLRPAGIADPVVTGLLGVVGVTAGLAARFWFERSGRQSDTRSPDDRGNPPGIV